jgi:hypothetical protein
MHQQQAALAKDQAQQIQQQQQREARGEKKQQGSSASHESINYSAGTSRKFSDSTTKKQWHFRCAN